MIATCDRRIALTGLAALMIAGCAERGGAKERDRAEERHAADARIRSIERRAGGRLGVRIIDRVSGRGTGWRADERFAHCSSFKLSLAAMVLAKGDDGRLDLAEILHWGQGDMLPVSPATAASLGSGLPVRELARAAVVYSDNTAANVLLRRFGGPAELTRFWRSLGDFASRLDRLEPELNVTPRGTELDTTTPAAMAATVSRLVDGTH